MRFRKSYRDSCILSSLNLPIIFPLRDIANLFECMAMFYFVKRLSALRIVTEPCADHILLFGGFSIFLHHILDVCGFRRGEERLLLFCAEMDNRIYGSFEHLACLVEHIRKQA